jgi:hypothetical protein
MVLVASSRSASTELPSEQNQPGRRFEQAAHPTGACRARCFCRLCASAVISAPVMDLPFPTPFTFLRRIRLPGVAGPGGSIADAKCSETPAKETFAG